MNCGIVCLIEYIKMLEQDSEEVIAVLNQYLDCTFLSIYDLMNILKEHDILLEAYYWKKIDRKGPYIIYLKKQKHFILVKQVGLMVTLYDQRIKNVKIPFLLFWLLYQGYYLKIIV